MSRSHSSGQRPASLLAVAVIVGGVALALVGIGALFIASAWGPGNSDETVSGGLELVPWYGLPTVAAVAAVAAPVLSRRPALAGGLLALSAASTVVWVLAFWAA